MMDGNREGARQTMRNHITCSHTFAGVLATGLILLSLQCFGVSSGASNVRASNGASLDSLVVSSASGFKSESVDKVGGGPTGQIGFSEATSADCDPAGLVRGRWEGSVLRYFDSNPSAPETYLILCVTRLRTAQEAIANRNRVIALGGASPSSALKLPGGYEHAVGPALQIFFAKGTYFVWIVATSLSSTVKVLALGASLAQREYALLPK